MDVVNPGNAGKTTDAEARPVTALKGVGPRLRERLQHLRLHTVQDLLFHLPFRYEDRTRLLPLGSLQPGMQAAVCGTIALSEVQLRGRRSLVCRIGDGTGSLTLRFFYFSARQQAQLSRGRRLRCFGEVRRGPAGLEMVHPEYAPVDGVEAAVEERLTPVYPTTEGVAQAGLRRLITQALDLHLKSIPEYLPQAVLAPLRLPSLQQALAYVHAPPADAPLTALMEGRHPAQQRLAFEELLAHHLSLRRLRLRLRDQRAPRIAPTGKLFEDLRGRLAFNLTPAQHRVIDEIAQDLRQGFPMQRLVQGDVGCGKTLVAAAAVLHVIESGWQAALMAPTELLAEQHWRNFQDWFAPLGLEVAWLGGKLKAKARRTMLEDICSGRARLAIGTHALFQEEVAFSGLGLVIVDEQHRFGVQQRLALREKGGEAYRPHQLIMSATPIPRTLAQVLYAELDVSVIDELPPGRTPVETVAVPAGRRDEVAAAVHRACLSGRQAYWVCPLIAEGEVLALQTAEETEQALRAALPDLRIGLIHGRLKSQVKEAVMAAFKAGAIDLLVATTVIEVGVDVPNASLMIIENSERLGLAQLHQLRGRVGRGTAEAKCVLLYQPPLSEYARSRLQCLRTTTDGFEIARKDLEMRGPGEMFGARQTGLPDLRIASLSRDRDVLPQVIQAANLILRDYPTQVQAIVRRWLGDREDYAEV